MNPSYVYILSAHLAKDDPVIKLLIHVGARITDWQEVFQILASFVDIEFTNVNTNTNTHTNTDTNTNA